MMKLGIKAEYQLQTLDMDGNVKQDTGWFPNAILDRFFTDLRDATSAANKPNPFQVGTTGHRLDVGTGSTAVAFNQTQLANRLTGMTPTTKSAETFTVDGSTFTVENTFTANFTLGSVVGNISEVGFAFRGSSTGAFLPAPLLHSRALVTDTNGNPTTITVTNQDQLVVRYKVRMTGQDVDGTGVLNFEGTNYTWTSRRGPGGASFGSIVFNAENMVLNAYSGGTFGTAGGIVSGATSLGALYMSFTPSGVLGRTCSKIDANITEGNGNISFLYNPTMPYKFQFVPPLPKTNTKVLRLTLGYDITRA